jgi:hypothetical protein
MRYLFILLLFPLLIPGCEKNDEINSNPDQRILFQVEYTNYAWGYQHNISLIDSTGVVTSYNMPPGWNTPDENGYISSAAMDENFSQVGTSSCTVNKAELKKFFGMLEEAQKGKLTTGDSGMRDFGAISYSGFIYDPLTEMYKEVFIWQYGDQNIMNSSEAAQKIYRWMTTMCHNN